MSNKLITSIVIVLLVIGGAFYMFKYVKAPTSNSPTEENIQQQNLQVDVLSNETVVVQPSAKITVEMTSSGFSPKELTVKKGSEVVFVNKDTIPHWPASGPHPAHTCYPGFDSLKPMAPGASYSHVFDIVKTCGFHDHINFGSYGYGNIIVTE